MVFGGLGLAALVGVTLILYFFYIHLENLNLLMNKSKPKVNQLEKMLNKSVKNLINLKKVQIKAMINYSNKLLDQYQLKDKDN